MWTKRKLAEDSSAYKEAYTYALWLLGTRWWGKGELRQRLNEKKFNPEVIGRILDELTKMGYLDDRRLLERLILRYKESGNYGKLYIQQKLKQKGFKDDEIKLALQTGLKEKVELASARKLVEKENKVWKTDEKAKARLIGKLQRRGFSSTITYRLIKIDTG